MDKLLKLLDTDARLTNAQLAVMLDKTEAEVGTQRLRNVINKNVTWDEIEKPCRIAFKGGYSSVKLYFMMGLPTETLEDIEGIAETVMRFEEVESVYLMSGGYDLSVVVNGRTFQEVAMFVAKRLSTLDSVISTATHFVLRRYKEKGVMFLGLEKDERGVM